MKLSSFLVYFPLEEKYLIYQTASRALLLLDEKTLSRLLKGRIDELSQDQLSTLKRNFILIDNHVDELRVYEYLMHLGKFNVQGLSYLILTAYDCNMECIYCYEKEVKARPYMSAEVADKTVKYILEQANKFNVNEVHLTWYGGEPLLNMNAITIIGDKLIENGLHVGSSLITNGTLLTGKILDKLMKYNLQSIQITIDGPPRVHNKRRPMKGGRSSFDVIYKNLKEIAHLGQEYSNFIGVRINTDKTNIEHIPELLQIFKNDSLNDKIGIGFGRTWNYSRCKYITLFTSKEYGEHFTYLMKLAVEMGFNRVPRLQLPFNVLGCGAYTVSTLIIDPLGNFYKCRDLVGNPEYSVGNLDGGINVSKHAKWVLRNPLTSKNVGSVLSYHCVVGGVLH